MSRRPTSKRNSPPNRERFVGSLIFVRGRARQTRCAHEQPRCRAGNPTIPRFPLSPSQSSRSFTAKASFHSQGPGQVTVDNGVPETRPRGHGYPHGKSDETLSGSACSRPYSDRVSGDHAGHKKIDGWNLKGLDVRNIGESPDPAWCVDLIVKLDLDSGAIHTEPQVRQGESNDLQRPATAVEVRSCQASRGRPWPPRRASQPRAVDPELLDALSAVHPPAAFAAPALAPAVDAAHRLPAVLRATCRATRPASWRLFRSRSDRVTLRMPARPDLWLRTRDKKTYRLRHLRKARCAISICGKDNELCSSPCDLGARACPARARRTSAPVEAARDQTLCSPWHPIFWFWPGQFGRLCCPSTVRTRIRCS